MTASVRGNKSKHTRGLILNWDLNQACSFPKIESFGQSVEAGLTWAYSQVKDIEIVPHFLAVSLYLLLLFDRHHTCSPGDETNWNVLCSSPKHPHSFCRTVALSGHVVRLSWSRSWQSWRMWLTVCSTWPHWQLVSHPATLDPFVKMDYIC